MTTAAAAELSSWLRQASAPGEFAERNQAASGVSYDALVPETALVETAREFLRRGFYLEDLTAVDFAECLEIVYHFNRWGASERCRLRMLAPKPGPKAPSLVSVYKSAGWYEREVHEMFGIRFEGHPNLKRLLLPESSEIFPLLKSFKGEPKGSDVAQSLKLIQEDAEGFKLNRAQVAIEKVNDKDYYLNLGPQHPSTHGVLRVLLHLSGERVLDAEPIIGYSHRHHEKMMELQTYAQCWPNFGRLDYVGAMSYNFGYALLIERAMGLRPSARVEAVRVLVTELNRIASHLLWMGTYLLDLGAFTPFFYCFDDREKILDLLEAVTGERLTYDYFRFGGLDKDLPDDFSAGVREFSAHFRRRLKDYDTLVTRNIIFQKRTKGLGILTRESALSYGVTGPNLRASGVPQDVRRDEPYSIYPSLDFDVPVYQDGDAFSRYLVRVREMSESLRIVEQLAGKLPAGEISLGKLPKSVPRGEVYASVEAARGLFGMYLVSDGTLNPYRLKLRTPSFANLNSLIDMLPGYLISDVIAILGSIDIVLPEIDR